MRGQGPTLLVLLLLLFLWPTPRRVAVADSDGEGRNPLGSAGSGDSGRHSGAEEEEAGPDPSTAAATATGGMTGGGAPTPPAQAYGEAWYWDERYRKETGAFDWYQKYPALKPLLSLYVAPHHRLLLVGCGNAVFGENMIDDGYQDVVNIDISSVVIEQMKKKYHDKPQLKYMKMDVRNMSDFESGSFDAVIDKGTLDALMCGDNSHENAAKMLEEVNRILKENGVYMLITYGDPSYRLRLLKEMENWTIKLHVIDRWEKSSNQNKWELTKPLPFDDDSTSVVALLGPKPDVHYIYVCVKGNGGGRAGSEIGVAAI